MMGTCFLFVFTLHLSRHFHLLFIRKLWHRHDVMCKVESWKKRITKKALKGDETPISSFHLAAIIVLRPRVLSAEFLHWLWQEDVSPQWSESPIRIGDASLLPRPPRCLERQTGQDEARRQSHRQNFRKKCFMSITRKSFFVNVYFQKFYFCTL